MINTRLLFPNVCISKVNGVKIKWHFDFLKYKEYNSSKNLHPLLLPGHFQEFSKLLTTVSAVVKIQDYTN